MTLTDLAQQVSDSHVLWTMGWLVCNHHQSRLTISSRNAGSLAAFNADLMLLLPALINCFLITRAESSFKFLRRCELTISKNLMSVFSSSPNLRFSLSTLHWLRSIPTAKDKLRSLQQNIISIYIRILTCQEGHKCISSFYHPIGVLGTKHPGCTVNI